MLAAVVLRRAALGIGSVDVQGVLVYVILVGMVQVTAVQVVDVTPVLDRGMPAVGTVAVFVPGVDGVLVIAHATSVRAVRS